MDKNPGKESASEAKGKTTEGAGKATGDKKAEKHGGKGTAVLGEINSDAKKAMKSTKKETK